MTGMVGLAWGLFAIYMVVTFVLAWLGHRRTKSFADFAVGGRSMSAGVAGLTLGATLASTATFVINPGFVYVWGLPALLALTVPLILGIFAGLLVLGPGFRRLGARAQTMPRWLGQRYGSEGLRLWFAALTVLHLFYIVLIVVGAAYVMVQTMGVSYGAAVTVVVAVVFTYIFFGGTYAHAYTNTAQGAVMLAVAGVLFLYALRDIGAPSDALAALSASDPQLTSWIHTDSPFYRNWLEVIVCPFAIGFALVAQPHLLIKTLYLKRSSDVARFVAIGGGCFVVFSLLLSCGIAARLRLGDGIAQDTVLAAWLADALPPALGAVVGVAILAAAMSTLDGLLVAVSAIVGADVVAHPAIASRFGLHTEEERARVALRAGRWTVLLLGALAWRLAMDPPALVGIFGTVGAYGLMVAALPGVLYGVVCKRAPSALVIGIASAAGLAIHMGLYYGGVTINTGLTASAGLVAAIGIPAPFAIWSAFAGHGEDAGAAVAPSVAPASSRRLVAAGA